MLFFQITCANGVASLFSLGERFRFNLKSVDFSACHYEKKRGELPPFFDIRNPQAEEV